MRSSVWSLLALLARGSSAQNSSYTNPILPGFHPDPSCIFVPEWDNTFFCASSSFNAFPGVPIHASKDLQNWKLASNALSRPEQLPALATTNRSTSGIWAPTLRYRSGTFVITTTLVFDHLPKADSARFDNIIFTSTDPYSSPSWSDPVHFEFNGYDTSPFWDDDGTVYVHGAHAWQTTPGIYQTTIDLKTGATGEVTNPWNGTGGHAPEGPHLYKKDGYYYFLLAEGGTGRTHMVTIARSRSVHGPFESDPSNPVLTNVDTPAYFQAVGHADLFQDAGGNWWAVALSVRSGSGYKSYPMGRETVLVPVTWRDGEFPIFTNVTGQVNGWHLPAPQLVKKGEGQLVNASDMLTFPAGSSLPPHLIYWRLPIADNYLVSPPGHEDSLQLTASRLNLTTFDGYYTGGAGQTFIARRQCHTLFTFTADIDFSDLKAQEDEIGVSLFLVERYHFDLGIVMLPTDESTPSAGGALQPTLRFRGMSLSDANATVTMPVPEEWTKPGVAPTLSLRIQAVNETHYAFSAGPQGRPNELTIGYCRGAQLSSGFTGSLVGAYATTNGRDDGSTFTGWVQNWQYDPQGQIVQ